MTPPKENLYARKERGFMARKAMPTSESYHPPNTRRNLELPQFPPPIEHHLFVHIVLRQIVNAQPETNLIYLKIFLQKTMKIIED